MRLPDPQRSRAVLIGTSRYADDKLPDLPSSAGPSVTWLLPSPIRSMASFLQTTAPCWKIKETSACLAVILGQRPATQRIFFWFTSSATAW